MANADHTAVRDLTEAKPIKSINPAEARKLRNAGIRRHRIICQAANRAALRLLLERSLELEAR